MTKSLKLTAAALVLAVSGAASTLVYSDAAWAQTYPKVLSAPLKQRLENYGINVTPSTPEQDLVHAPVWVAMIIAIDPQSRRNYTGSPAPECKKKALYARRLITVNP